MIYSRAEIFLIVGISFVIGIIFGSVFSFIYWRKRVLTVKKHQKVSFIKIYFIVLISTVWLIMTMGEALFNGPAVSIFIHIMMGGVTGVVLGPDFARYMSGVRMNIGSNQDNKYDKEDSTKSE